MWLDCLNAFKSRDAKILFSISKSKNDENDGHHLSGSREFCGSKFGIEFTAKISMDSGISSLSLWLLSIESWWCKLASQHVAFNRQHFLQQKTTCSLDWNMSLMAQELTCIQRPPSASQNFLITPVATREAHACVRTVMMQARGLSSDLKLLAAVGYSSWA